MIREPPSTMYDKGIFKTIPAIEDMYVKTT